MALKALNAFSKEEVARLKAAIINAEKRTSGEIRLFIEDKSKDEPLDRAAFLFSELKMDKTELRNGVLIYLSFLDHKFCIIGDYGIHEKVGENFWNAIKEKMLSHFKAGEITLGLETAITEAGEALNKYFPYLSDDTNELSDDIIFGEKK